jgi:hypothetical protein
MTLREALTRTLLLARDEVRDDVDDDVLLAALTATRVALVADATNLASHSAQTAFVTCAMLMARSGHQVYLLSPDPMLAGRQPPLASGQMLTELMRTGADLLPGVSFMTEYPSDEIDLVIALGSSEIPVRARRRARLNATPWAGSLLPDCNAGAWGGGEWPMGGMVAAALGATEAFKVAMKKLAHLAKNPSRMVTVFADTTALEFALAPAGTPCATQLGSFDCVSGGAIVNAILYALTRIPNVAGSARVIEPECSDLSNLNRYMLLLRSRLKSPKASDLAAICTAAGLSVEPIDERYDQDLAARIRFPTSVLVGVDDIPTRWLVQRAGPDWLGVGATTHWSAMSSFHEKGLGCAECLHPTDDPSDALIPTAAFVSFWAGLLTTAYFLRHLAENPASESEQQIYLTPFRAENVMRASVPLRNNCPSCVAVAA